MSLNNNDISIKEDEISVNTGILPIDIHDKDFDLLMNIYKVASEQVLKAVDEIQVEYSKLFEYSIINHTTSRIKAPQSILNKMKKKNLELSYESLVDNINDIAGVRVICPIKDDIYTIVKIIEKLPRWRVLKSKDYIKKPKKSGYSGYHLIVEVPTVFEVGKSKQEIFVKVEIQLRTMAMDFWATNEHKMKYKTNKKLSFFDSKKLAIYAKILNVIDNRFARIARKQV